jgi:MFS family permease
MDSPERKQSTLSLPALIAGSALSAAGASFFYIMPLIVGTSIEQLDLGSEQAGLLGSAWMTGFLFGAILAAFWINRINWRKLAAAAATGTLAGLIVFSFYLTYQALLVGLVILGIFMGTLYALAFSIMAEARQPDRAIGVKLLVETLMGAGLLFFLTQAIIGTWGLQGIFFTQIVLFVLIIPCVALLPTASRKKTDRVRKDAARNSTISPFSFVLLAVWLGIFGQVLFMLGDAGFWAFSERIGAQRGFDHAEIGGVLAAAQLAGGSGAFLAILLGGRIGRLTPIIIASLSILICCLVLLLTSSFVAYGACTFLFIFFANYAMPYQAGLTASADTDGRIMAFFAASVAAGAALGPGLAGFAQHYFTNGAIWIALVAVFLSLLAYFAVARLVRLNFTQESSHGTN